MTSPTASGSASRAARWLTSCVVGHWTDDPIKLLGVWFKSVTQIEKSWSQVTGRVETLVRTQSGRQLFSKERVNVEQVFIASVITCRLSVIPCPDSWLNLLSLFFRLL